MSLPIENWQLYVEDSLGIVKDELTVGSVTSFEFDRQLSRLENCEEIFHDISGFNSWKLVDIAHEHNFVEARFQMQTLEKI